MGPTTSSTTQQTLVVQSAQIISLLKLILTNRDRLFSGGARTLYMDGPGAPPQQKQVECRAQSEGSGGMLPQDHPTKNQFL